MDLLVIRHGVAEDKEKFARSGRDDALRPLTSEGRWKMETIAKGLRRAAPSIASIASSGFVRADQTAKIIAKEYEGLRVQLLEAIQPGHKPAELLVWLKKQPEDDVVAIVGHEPHLSETVSYLLTGRSDNLVAVSKGGAIMLEFAARPKAGAATLRWALEPSHLRRLAR
jgi:phosphohistidine phosphatase